MLAQQLGRLRNARFNVICWKLTKPAITLRHALFGDINQRAALFDLPANRRSGQIWYCKPRKYAEKHQHDNHPNEGRSLPLWCHRWYQQLVTSTTRRAREGNHITNIGEAGRIRNRAFKAKAEPCVWHRPITPQVSIPTVVRRIESTFEHTCV